MNNSIAPEAFFRQVCDDYAATLAPSARYAFVLVSAAHLAKIQPEGTPAPEAPPQEE